MQNVQQLIDATQKMREQIQGELQRFSNRLIAIHLGELRQVSSQLHDGMGSCSS
jgi:hypothetical protein